MVPHSKEKRCFLSKHKAIWKYAFLFFECLFIFSYCTCISRRLAYFLMRQMAEWEGDTEIGCKLNRSLMLSSYKITTLPSITHDFILTKCTFGMGSSETLLMEVARLNTPHVPAYICAFICNILHSHTSQHPVFNAADMRCQTLARNQPWTKGCHLV